MNLEARIWAASVKNWASEYAACASGTCKTCAKRTLACSMRSYRESGL